jgi:transcriptional regulator with XRE-family HTH domain
LETKQQYPYAHTKITKFLARHLETIQSEKTQRQIAQELGYKLPNIISMWKRGEARVPLDKIPDLAKVIHVDPLYLMRLGIDQIWSEESDLVAKLFESVLTENEQDIIVEIRKLTRNSDPPLAKVKRSLERAFPPSSRLKA